MEKIEQLKKQLEKVEKQLDKCRTSTMQDGWQTQRFAKKSRNWDYYAQEKMRLIEQIEVCEDKELMCEGCNCWKHTRAICS
jgi:allantoicase